MHRVTSAQDCHDHHRAREHMDSHTSRLAPTIVHSYHPAALSRASSIRPFLSTTRGTCLPISFVVAAYVSQSISSSDRAAFSCRYPPRSVHVHTWTCTAPDFYSAVDLNSDPAPCSPSANDFNMFNNSPTRRQHPWRSTNQISAPLVLHRHHRLHISNKYAFEWATMWGARSRDPGSTVRIHPFPTPPRPLTASSPCVCTEWAMP